MAYSEIRDWIIKLKPGKSNKDIYVEYGGIDRDSLLKMYRAMVLARRVEQEEKTLLRKGLSRFFIGCGGKELIDVVAAQALNPDDPHVGYYRNKAFDMYRGVPIIQKI